MFRSTNIDISIDPFTGRNPSYCFVDIAHSHDASRALETIQGQNVRGRSVRINFNTKKRRKTTRPNTKTYDLGWKAKDIPANDVNEDAYAFNRWDRKDASTHWTAPYDEGRRLYVGGLPRISGQDIVNAEMKQLFSGWHVEAVSKIISPHVSKQSQPGSHYYCFVDLSTAQDAQEAAQTLDGKRTPYGGSYKVRLSIQRRPAKVHREQLDGIWQEQKPETRKRDLDGDWRKLNG